MGKPYHQALGEIENTVPRINWFMDNCEKALKTKTVFEDDSTRKGFPRSLLGLFLIYLLGTFLISLVQMFLLQLF